MRRRPSYSAGAKDKRVGEAQAFLKVALHLRNITENGLACQFNLERSTAAQLLKYEHARRGETAQ